MTNYRPYPHKPPAARPSIDLGPRLRREIELRLREVKARLHPTTNDHAEMARLRRASLTTESIMVKEAPLTAARLREVIHYDPASGVFTWLPRPVRGHMARTDKRWNMVFAGTAAGTFCKGYRYIELDGRRYGAHRLACLWMEGRFPPHEIDHANCDRADNRWINLRKTSRSGNVANAGPRRDNTSGFKGVHLVGKRWRADIKAGGKQYHLGYFPTPEEAHAASCKFAKAFFGEFARGEFLPSTVSLTGRLSLRRGRFDND